MPRPPFTLRPVPASTVDPLRRALLKAGLLSAAAPLCQPLLSWGATATGEVVNDITGMNPVAVTQVATPRSNADIQQALRQWPGPVSIGGGRFSMGGQIASPGSLHLDMRRFNRLLSLEPRLRLARVQAGMSWRELQQWIDPHGLAVKIMQSYANFSIGGSLSVNAHGRYVGLGPLVNAVRSIVIALADGSLLSASRQQRPEVFFAAIGAYGALGVICEVELELTDNQRLERQVNRMSLDDYRDFFFKHVRADSRAVMHNADLAPPYFQMATAVTWRVSDKSLTDSRRLTPQGQRYWLQEGAIRAWAELPGGPVLRKKIADPLRFARAAVLWRNREASLDVASLGRIADAEHSFVLQEYFVPVAKLEHFVAAMATILETHKVAALNVSIRHSPADAGTVLAWARQEVFSLVLYYRQGKDEAARRQVGQWTRQLIDAALAQGGSYYLPYQLHASREQFHQAYPGAGKLLALKRVLDPASRFRNQLWNQYLMV